MFRVFRGFPAFGFRVSGFFRVSDFGFRIFVPRHSPRVTRHSIERPEVEEEEEEGEGDEHGLGHEAESEEEEG